MKHFYIVEIKKEGESWRTCHTYFETRERAEEFARVLKKNEKDIETRLVKADVLVVEKYVL